MPHTPSGTHIMSRARLRRPVLRVLAAFALLAGALVAQDAPPPNVVVIFCDDLGYGDLSCQGEQRWRTPHLDRLAAEGVRFTDFCVAQPVCSASRASLLTGCYANRIGIHGALGPNAKTGLNADEVTLAELCRSKGYATAIHGKWHLGHHEPFLPLNHGFDEYSGIPYSNDMWPMHPEAPKGSYPPLPLFEGHEVVAENPDQRAFTSGFTQRVCDFIRSNAERPFFAYLAHPMPHVPLYVSEAGDGASGAGLLGDVIAEIDAGVGQIVATLDELGLTERTLVLFTSDNGPWLSYGDHAGTTGGLREGKGTTFEGGVRVPCIARWPGTIPAGRVSGVHWMTIDVLPTVASLIGASLPEHPIDGRDATDVLLDEPGAQPPRDASFFWYHRGDLEAVRAGRWKLHLDHGYRTMDGQPRGGGGEPGRYRYDARIADALFDLEADPFERHDLSAEHPEIVEELRGRAEAMAESLGDRLRDVVGRDVREPGRLP